MKLTQIKIKLFGKTQIMFRAVNSKGEVVQVFETEQEGKAWINQQ